MAKEATILAIVDFPPCAEPARIGMIVTVIGGTA